MARGSTVVSSLASGRRAGRAEALTVVMPLRRGGAAYLAAWLTYLRLLPERGCRRRPGFLPTSRSEAVGTLDRLRFVSAICWSLLPPFTPGRGWQRPADARWHLLFESNFDGDWDDYLDAFGAVMSLPLQTIVGVGRGFPGLDDIDLFKAYTKRHDVTPVHYVSAYDDLTAGDIHQGLLGLEGDGARLTARRRGFGRSHPGWTRILLPLRPGRASAAIVAAEALDEELPALAGRPPDRPRPLLLWTGLVHFGRVCVLTRPSGDWLLLSFTHDGTTRQLLEALVAEDRAHAEDPAQGGAPTTRLRRLLECCAEIPGPSEDRWDDEALVDHLEAVVRRSPRWSMAYCGYPGRTVREVQALRAATADDPRWPEPEEPS